MPAEKRHLDATYMHLSPLHYHEGSRQVGCALHASHGPCHVVLLLQVKLRGASAEPRIDKALILLPGSSIRGANNRLELRLLSGFPWHIDGKGFPFPLYFF